MDPFDVLGRAVANKSDLTLEQAVVTGVAGKVATLHFRGGTVAGVDCLSPPTVGQRIWVLVDRARLLGLAAPAVPTVVTDHGMLSGLGDNDHPQYLLRDGSAPMTGQLLLPPGSPSAALAAAPKEYVDAHPGQRGVVAPASGYTDYNGYGLHATKVGEVLVNLEGQFKVTSAFTSDGYSKLLGTIPVGFRPTKAAATAPGFLASVSPTASSWPCGIIANSGGDLRWVIASGIAVPLNGAVYCNVTYRIGA